MVAGPVYLQELALSLLRPQERLDHAAERLLARPAPRLLPKLPDYSAVPGSRGPCGVGTAGPPGAQGPAGLGLGALVPEDACLRLHVHGLCAALAGRHAALLGLHLLLYPRAGRGGARAGLGAGRGQSRPAEGLIPRHRPCPCPGEAPGGVSCRPALASVPGPRGPLFPAQPLPSSPGAWPPPRRFLKNMVLPPVTLGLPVRTSLSLFCSVHGEVLPAPAQ